MRKILTFLFCYKLIMLLKGYNCEIIRTDDTTGATDVSLANRVKKANTWGADVFLSIHHNAGANGKSAGGTVVYYCSSKKERPLQAKELYDAVVKETELIGNRVTKVKNYPFYVIKNTTMPAFLLENGFTVPGSEKRIAFLMEKGLSPEKTADVLRLAQEERKTGARVLTAVMIKNKKFQKEQLKAEGYEEIREFYERPLEG